MKKESLIDSIGQIDLKFIEEAQAARCTKNKKGAGLKWAAAAACAAVVLAVGFGLMQKENLPQVSLPDSIAAEMGTGEIYFADSAEQLIGKGYWNESMKIQKLPVYENPLTYNGDGGFAGGDTAEMNELLNDVINRFKLEASSFEIQADFPYSITAKGKNISISVTQVMNAVISFNTPAKPVIQPKPTAAQLEKAAELLKGEYATLINMKKPVANICGEYSVDGEPIYTLSFYEGNGSLQEQIVNSNFNSVTFYFDENGAVSTIVISRPDLSKRLGDYKLINADEAVKQLKKGNYITTLTREIEAEDTAEKVQLVYRTDSREKYFMPYYKIFVELPEESRNGFNAYGVYYVPAIKMLAE